MNIYNCNLAPIFGAKIEDTLIFHYDFNHIIIKNKLKLTKNSTLPKKPSQIMFWDGFIRFIIVDKK